MRLGLLLRKIASVQSVTQQSWIESRAAYTVYLICVSAHVKKIGGIPSEKSIVYQ
jgi:hypothetical protein